MSHNHTGHMRMMIIACGGAFLLIFVLPLFGVSEGWSAGIAVVAMIGLHLLMMRGRSANNAHTNDARRYHGK